MVREPNQRSSSQPFKVWPIFQRTFGWCASRGGRFHDKYEKVEARGLTPILVHSVRGSGQGCGCAVTLTQLGNWQLGHLPHGCLSMCEDLREQQTVQATV